ncbi:hypothetical protein ACE04B_39070, partial [Rhizobium phaseoli]
GRRLLEPLQHEHQGRWLNEGLDFQNAEGRRKRPFVPQCQQSLASQEIPQTSSTCFHDTTELLRCVIDRLPPTKLWFLGDHLLSIGSPAKQIGAFAPADKDSVRV